MSRMWTRRESSIAAAGLALCVAVAVAAAAAGSAAATPAAGEAGAPTGRAIVEVATPSLPAGRSLRARRAWRRERARAGGILARVADRNGLAAVNRIPETGQLGVELGGEGVSGLRKRLADDPRVERVTADHPVEFRHTPNDYAFSRPDSRAPGRDLYQWNLVRSNGPAAWDLSRGVGAEVAVIDSGANVTHPDLNRRIAGTLNCVAGCSGTNVADSEGHGTHVAGLACGDSDNGYGIASLGFDCNLFIIKIGSSCLDASDAIVAAANRRSDAINMSFGGCTSSMNLALSYAWSRGSVPVAAGTNCPVPNGTMGCSSISTNYPAQGVQPEGTGPNLDSGRGVTVTAAKYGGTRASFAQRTSGVSLAGYGAATNSTAAGQGILSTWIAGSGSCGSCRTTLNGDNRFAYLVGTSMATPQVAGLVALMRSINPALPPARLIRAMKATASHCGSYRSGIGWGVIDAERAVVAAADRDLDPPASRVKKLKGKKARRAFRRKRVRLLKVKRADEGIQRCGTALRNSGVKTINVFVSRNGKRYRRLTKTKRKQVRFRPKRKGRYRFVTRAVDKAGNREAWPAKADAKLRVKRVRPRR